MTSCSIEACATKVACRGFCQRHYRLAKLGRLPGVPARVYSPRTSGSVADRFWSKVDGSDYAECWLWTGSRSERGYGRLNINGKPRRAHRVAYELMVGEIPQGLEIDHLCRVRACVNPWHLEPVTHAVNLRRITERVS